jgi:hypothetical protein
MKRWFLIPVLSLTISLQCFAQTPANNTEDEEQILLNYDEFSHLTHAEKKTYVKKLREIMIETAKAFPEMAEAMSPQSEFYAQLWTLMVASAESEDSNAQNNLTDESRKAFIIRGFQASVTEYVSLIQSTNTKKLTDEQRGLLVQRYRQALVWTALAEQTKNGMVDKNLSNEMAKDVINPLKAKVEAAETKVKGAAGTASYEKEKSYLQKTIAESKKLNRNDPPPIDFIVAGVRLPALSIKADGTTTSTAPVTKTEEKPSAKAETKKEEKKPEAAPIAANKDKKTEEKKAGTASNKDLEREKQKAANVANKNTKSETVVTQEQHRDIYYRCMYAGFVIQNHPCMAPSDLPWDLKGLDTATFKCDKGTVMCNPFLFGFKTACDWSKATDEKGTAACLQDAKPFCVRPGLYATKNCNDNSTSESAKEAAVHLIEQNKAAFNLYGVSFDNLCNNHLINFNSYEGQRKPRNIARTRADIKRTCDNARVRMQDIRARYYLKHPPKDSPAPPAAQPPKENKAAK